ncbi:uncharacterized protein [Lolium perenne]|uniref:uncharacterized protein n=1 Tax=Lolium perenne TaxID=4522 RepID=UPI003A99A336
MEGDDIHIIDSPSSPPFSTREAYMMLSSGRPVDVSASTTWALRLPSKPKIFAYLADIDWLSTRANLFYKNCAPSTVCVACPAIEMGRHIFFDCPLAAALWRRLKVAIPAGEFSLWDLPSPMQTTIDARCSAVAVLLWSLWKAQNDRVFSNNDTPLTAVVRRACDDLSLWRWHFKEDDRAPLDSLHSYLLTCIA